MQFNLRLKLRCSFPPPLGTQTVWCLPVVTIGSQATSIQNCSPNLLMSCTFCQWAEKTKLSGGGCSRNVSCGRSSMVNWNWRDRSWQQHSLGHEHKLPCLRNQPIVPTLSLPSKNSQESREIIPQTTVCCSSRKYRVWSKSKRWELKWKHKTHGQTNQWDLRSHPTL